MESLRKWLDEMLASSGNFDAMSWYGFSVELMARVERICKEARRLQEVACPDNRCDDHPGTYAFMRLYNMLCGGDEDEGG